MAHMIRKIIPLSILLGLISTAQAGQLFRYPDAEGVPTLSTTLPAEAAQRGYDVLDANSMRLIKHVAPAPTKEQIAEMERKAAEQAEQKRLAEIAAKKAEKKRQQQAVYDHTLLTTYQSENDLIKARDNELNYRKKQIETHQSKLPELESHLVELQQQAAEQELSGKKISVNMQKRLDAAQEEVNVRKEAITRLQSEIDDLTQTYAQDLTRLKYLLELRTKSN